MGFLTLGLIPCGMRAMQHQQEPTTTPTPPIQLTGATHDSYKQSNPSEGSGQWSDYQ